MKNDNVQILTEGKQVSHYIERVQTLADSNKKALGFLPKSVFRDQANNNRLWVAINANSGELLGYLLWGGRYPMLKVFHLYVAQQNRKQGIGAKLLSSLEAFAEKKNYLTISARVAADLTANKFWDHSGFPIISQEAGGQTSKRTINIRYKELDTPSLMKMMSHEMVTPGKDLQSLKLRPRPILSKQTYVLDLNVSFDVVKKRLHRTEASHIISGLNHEIRVYVTPEFTAELNKHSKTDNSDPILEFAQQLPTLPEINQNEVDRLIKKLKAIVFPDQPNAEVPGSRSRSDLAHLAYCIHHRVTGFITRDKAILSVNAQLQEEYLLEVLSAADLMQSGKRTKKNQGRLSANLDNENFSIGPAKEKQRDEIEQFLLSFGVNIENLKVIWHPGISGAQRRRITARIGDRKPRNSCSA
jgi:GNAT superfamily N-acetyltransferase/predicted nucleic acid-binding protein